MSLDLYTHISTPPAPGAPLLFTFHGTGGDEHQFAGLMPQILPGAGLVSPRGDVSEHGANRFFRRTGEGVYDMDDLARRTAKMAAFVAAHRAAHPGAAVYGLGYSNGANILASVLFQAPDLFDRAALLHPLIPAPAATAGSCRAPHPHHRRAARPDLPASPDRGAGQLVHRPRRANRSDAASRRARGSPGRNHPHQNLPATGR
ncbi:MAG: alpha/beta hydrolase [Gemmobacter sp.]|nr:alpha/beta hydrolase [Gemmobacter sp.]